MDYAQVFAISGAGMSIERLRVDVAALNIANANTVQTVDGMNYQPLQVVARSVAAPEVGSSFSEHVDRALDVAGIGLPQGSIEARAASPRMAYEPGHPFANEKGFVTYPGVDNATEMVGLMRALRAYEANVAAMNAARTLALKALEIGGGA